MTVASRRGMQHLGRWINTGVIWAIRSRWRKKQIFRQKIDDLSLKNHWNIDDFLLFGPTFPLNWRFIAWCRFISDISTIFCRFSAIFLSSDFSPQNIVSTSSDARYIIDILTFSSMSVWPFLLYSRENPCWRSKNFVFLYLKPFL